MNTGDAAPAFVMRPRTQEADARIILFAPRWHKSRGLVAGFDAPHAATRREL
jgi:hypothetical protein